MEQDHFTSIDLGDDEEGRIRREILLELINLSPDKKRKVLTLLEELVRNK
jgi:hypothetical protein|tara:strand:+ start:2844 stop:2993 length:150 start_codon:yes stop_codon:yes gene_type:complete